MGSHQIRPLLPVLDEPTVALDPGREHAFIEVFARPPSWPPGRRAGVTALVSHRFSTVRMADLIVVIDGGRVRESGSHEDSIRRGGLYAELFRRQAQAYS